MTNISHIVDWFEEFCKEKEVSNQLFARWENTINTLGKTPSLVKKQVSIMPTKPLSTSMLLSAGCMATEELTHYFQGSQM